MEYVIKEVQIDEDAEENYLYDCDPISISWTSINLAKKFNSLLEAELFIKKNFIRNGMICEVQ